MSERFIDLFFKRLVPSLKFRKMRLNGHVASLLRSDWCLTWVRWVPDLPTLHQLHGDFDLALLVQCSNPRIAIPVDKARGAAANGRFCVRKGRRRTPAPGSA